MSRKGKKDILLYLTSIFIAGIMQTASHECRIKQGGGAGFTLVEISVVIVIIGLLVGGILTGKEMIHASEVASVATDADKLRAAIIQFQNQYGALPGDFEQAKSYWPAATNGNGNGKIDYNGGAAGEEYTAWQDLSLAGLVPGNYTGTVTSTEATVGQSLPASKVSTAYYRVSYQTGVSNGGIYGRYGNYISINKYNPLTQLVNKAVLSPADVYSMDVKFDDGYAPTGSIMGFNEQSLGGCVSNDYTSTTGTYLMTSNLVTCKIFFVTSNSN